MKGLRLHLPPFAPDDAGATSVLYPLGGLVTILDAGGCAGNLCGFDEPRFYESSTPAQARPSSRTQAILREGGSSQKGSFSCKETQPEPETSDVNTPIHSPSTPAGRVSVEPVGSPRPTATTKPSSANCAAPHPSIFTSAALRDMDAILGRDTALLKKLAAAAQTLHTTGRPLPFLALIGTPVPAVIGTDLPALARLAEKNLRIPALPIETDGTAPYDTGIEKTYQALLTHLAHIPTTKNPPAPSADSEQSERFRPLGASPTSAKTSPSSGGRVLCDSERSGEHPSGAEKNNKAALKNTTSDSPSSPRTIAREDSPLSESTQSPRPTATTNDPSRPRTIALGSRLNADPLDLALLLTSCGFTITDIITTLDPSDTYFLTLLKTVSPNTRLHGALDPSMADFHPAILPDLTLGADAATYYPGVPNIPWNEEIQPFGYQAPITLLKAIQTALHLS